MINQKVRYKQARDFGQIFSATFSYVKQNFRSFFSAIALFTVPFVAIMVFLVGYLVSNYTAGGSFNSMSGTDFIGSMFLVIFIIFVLLLLMQTVYVTVINEHLIINEQLQPGETLPTSIIASRFFSSFWRILGNCILLSIFGFIFLLVYAVINSAITAVFSSAGVGGVLLAGILQLATSLMITPVIGYVFISALFVVQRDKIGILSALGKVFKYLKNNFWQTWCVSVAGYLMTYICSGIAMIPAIIFIILQVVSRVQYSGDSADISLTSIIIGSAIFIVTITLTMCIYSIYFLMCNFQYTSLEEKKEGNSIIEKISQIQ